MENKAKEKAQALVDKFKPLFEQYGVSYHFITEDCKQCALIAVDEMLKISKRQDDSVYGDKIINFLNQVKTEITNL